MTNFRVYGRVDGKLACWEVVAENHRDAIEEVQIAYGINRVMAVIK